MELHIVHKDSGSGMALFQNAMPCRSKASEWTMITEIDD